MSDQERRQFILDLDESDLEINDWESQFVKSIIDKNISSFTDRQRIVIDNMIEKYDDKIL